MKDYSNILFRAKEFVQADEFMDDDYYEQLYICIRKFLDDIDDVLAMRCVLNEAKNAGKKIEFKRCFSIGLEGKLKEKTNKKFTEQFKQIKEELHPKSNLTNLFWIEASLSGASNADEFLGVVENLKKKFINNKKG